MKKLYIIRDFYEPNIASINRCLAFAKGYGELGASTEVVFIIPNYQEDKVKESYSNVTFTYLWERYYPKNKYLKHIFCRLLLFRYILKLKKNDKVILYSPVNPWYLFLFSRRVKIYNEITEHPSEYFEKKGLIGKTRYLQFKYFYKRIDGFLTISPSLNNYFVNELGISKDKVCTINMIVDSSRFENIVIKGNKSTIAYCGTISERKDGISDLIKAFKKVSTQYTDISLTLMGRFENNITKKNVQKLIKTLNIEDKVVITGVVEADQMPLLLSEAKILVLSRPQNRQAQYGFPTKLGEYLMTANPIVITDVGDFKAYLKDKEEIIYTLPDNSDDFADKLIWVLNNYEKAKKIGMNGRKVALRSFNYKIEARKVLNFIGFKKNDMRK